MEDTREGYSWGKTIEKKRALRDDKYGLARHRQSVLSVSMVGHDSKDEGWSRKKYKYV